MTSKTEKTGEMMTMKALYSWKIDNFYKRNTVPAILHSPAFYANYSKWNLVIYPMGTLTSSPSYKDYVSIYLQLFSTVTTKIAVEVDFKITLLDDRNEILKSHSSKHEFISRGKTWGFPQYITKNILKGLSTKTFTILCDIKGCNNPELDRYYESISNTVEQVVLNSFDKFLNNEQFSDVKLKIGRRVFFAHKNILANKSEVFAAMFEHDMQENASNTVEITDVDAEVMYELLRFVYTGEVNDNAEIIKRLVIAAEKYALFDLKSRCEGYLCNILCTINLIDLLDLASRHNLQKLKLYALRFIKTNCQTTLDNPQFKHSLKSLDSSIFIEILQHFADNTEGKKS